MAATRGGLRDELERRLGDTANVVWSVADLNGFLDYAITSLYPSWYRRRVATTTAEDGPIQVAPAGARNVYRLGLQRTGSNRVRSLRGWDEGDGDAYVPKTGIAGDTLVWSWTSGWDAPADDTEALSIPAEAVEAVLVRAQISSMERLLVDRVSAQKYLTLQVRESITEDDIATALDALHATLREHLDKALPLPEVNR